MYKQKREEINHEDNIEKNIGLAESPKLKQIDQNISLDEREEI